MTERTSANLTFLLLGDEWSPTKGGISTFNRSMATALVACGHRVVCLVSRASADERDDAARRGVRLVAATSTPGGPNLLLHQPSLAGLSVDVVVGHDRITGDAAWAQARLYFPDARLVHVVHTAPMEIEPYKTSGNAARRIEEREAFMRRMAAEADVVVAVGPRLTRATQSVVDDGFGLPRVEQIDPGLDVPDGVLDRRRSLPPNVTVLLLGRTDDIELKGQDLAARAVAGAAADGGLPTVRLRVRGAAPEECDELRAQLVGRSGLTRDQVDVRAYSDDVGQISNDLRQAALCLMPSRVEGFGLVALEAISLGTPVLVSSRSGVAELLDRRLGGLAGPMIVDVVDDLSRDTAVWARAVRGVLTNPTGAFELAHRVRSALAAELRWDTALNRLLKRLTDGGHDEPAAADFDRIRSASGWCDSARIVAASDHIERATSLSPSSAYTSASSSRA